MSTAAAFATDNNTTANGAPSVTIEYISEPVENMLRDPVFWYTAALLAVLIIMTTICVCICSCLVQGGVTRLRKGNVDTSDDISARLKIETKTYSIDNDDEDENGDIEQYDNRVAFEEDDMDNESFAPRKKQKSSVYDKTKKKIKKIKTKLNSSLSGPAKAAQNMDSISSTQRTRNDHSDDSDDSGPDRGVRSKRNNNAQLDQSETSDVELNLESLSDEPRLADKDASVILGGR